MKKTKTLNQLALSKAEGVKEKTPVLARGKLLRFLSPLQRAFVVDPHRFKVVTAGRRGGKTLADAVYLIMTCLDKPSTATLYLGLTRDSAKDAIWDQLITLLESLEIPHEPQLSKLRIEFPNGSFIRLFGADMSNARNRLRGPKYSLIIVDETGFYAGVDELVEALLPTLADMRGTLAMTSSPGELLSGLFYEAYEGDKKDKWSQHHWTMLDNPHFQKPALDPRYKTHAEEELATICDLKFGGNREDPAFVREYLGKYVKDATRLIYPIPDGGIKDQYAVPRIQYSIGVAFGLADQVGIVRMAHSEYAREVHITNCWLGTYTAKELAALLETQQTEKVSWTFLVGDFGPYPPEVAKEFVKRYGLSIKSVDNKKNTYYQNAFREDLEKNYITCKPDLQILGQWARIVKDGDGIEIAGQRNLLANAALVVYRQVYQSFLKDFTPPPTIEEIMESQLREAALNERDQEEEDRRESTYYA